MKLLVSDYSGTFKIDKGSLYLNKYAVEDFINSGNKFVLSTNASYESIKNEISYYNINYDYLMCNNGHITLDKNDNIINYNYLTEDSLYEIMDNLKNVDYIKKYKVGNSIAEILAVFYNVKDAKKNEKEILLGNKYLPIRFKNFLYISNKYDKVDAINNLAKMLKICETDIYTIGDSKRDLSMLKRFNGYKVEICDSELLFKNIKTVPGVYELVKKINR